MSLDKAALLAGRKLKQEKVDVPELGGAVYVRMMTGNERDEYDGEIYDYNQRGKRFENFRARLLVRCLCDEAGTLMFAPSDAAAVGELPPSITLPLFEVATRLNRL